jgi:hypothetical protein
VEACERTLTEHSNKLAKIMNDLEMKDHQLALKDRQLELRDCQITNLEAYVASVHENCQTKGCECVF